MSTAVSSEEKTRPMSAFIAKAKSAVSGLEIHLPSGGFRGFRAIQMQYQLPINGFVSDVTDAESLRSKLIAELESAKARLTEAQQKLKALK